MPVLCGLRNDPAYTLCIYAGEFGRPVLKEEGFAFESVPTYMKREDVRAVFDKEKPDLLLSATSWNSDVEQQFRNVACEKKVPSVVVFDFWSNPALRWKDSAYSLGKMPDTVCVMDEAYRQVMIQDGFPADQLIVTGQPHLERLWETKRNLRSAPRLQKILFLSQPKEILQIKGDRHPLSMIIEAIGAYAKDHECVLTVKFHPKENEEELKDILVQAPKNKNLKIEIAERLAPLPELVEDHDVVLGYRSMGLFEVKSMGRAAMALDGCLIEPSLATALENFGIPVVAMKDLADLGNAWKKADRPMEHNPYGGATERILAVIKRSLLKLTGERVYLKPFTAADISAEYIGWFNDPVVCADNTHGDPRNPYNEQKAKEYLRSVEYSDTAHVFAIRWKDNDKHIGNCAISSIDWVKKTGMCTIIIGDKDYWKRGVGTEVYELLLEFGFEQLGLEKITSGQTTRNAAMVKICENVGMKNMGLSGKKLNKNGEALDIVEFAITKNVYKGALKI